MNFTHLHLHSTYSFQDGYGTPEQYVQRAKELGMEAIAITDHGNISAHYKWFKACKKEGIKPILGCEFYLESEERKKRNHITVLAKNKEGYNNLTKLVTKSWKNFYYKPLLKKEWLFENSEGLIVLSGCPAGRINKFIESGNLEQAEKELLEFKNSIKDFYIEIMPVAVEGSEKLIPILYNFSKKLNIPMVATMDCHYVLKGQDEIQEILLCIQSRDRMSNPKRWKFDQKDFYLKNREEMKESFKVLTNLDMTEAFDNTMKIAEMVNFEFEKAEPLRVDIKDKKKYIEDICLKSLKEKGLENKEYIERFKYELDLIEKKDFLDYFIIVYDMVNWAKNNDILVGPARGSAAGSLVCFLMHITEVDPLKYGLIFERFIDLNREDLPDIDVDFEDEKRPVVKAYLENKYGFDKVGQLCTFAVFKGKSVIKDLARIFAIPFEETEKLKNLIIERSGGDSRASFTIHDTFEMFDYAKQMLQKYPCLKYAEQLEGQIRQMSKHASGFVISNQSLESWCATYEREGDSWLSMDYDDANSLGLIKFDILGLNTLTCIKKTMELIGKSIDLYSLTLDDEKVFDNFNNHKKTFGVFQFDGQSVNQVCRQIKPRNFEDLSAINALSRPGPMHGVDTEIGEPITTIYIERRNGTMPLKYAHPLMEPITKDTQGVVIYQEQVMKTMREVGKMSWKDTANIRKAISKSQGLEAFNKYREVFAQGAKEQKLTDSEIDAIWMAICTHGSWSFNKSHSVSYSIISYWCMWLKTYYPAEFYCAVASTMHQEDKIKKTIKEYVRDGNKLLPIDVNKSKYSFTIDNGLLRLGFKDIKGIGPKTVDKILSNQPYKNLEDFKQKKSANKTITQNLIKLGAFEDTDGLKEEISFEEKLKISPYSVDFSISEKYKSVLEGIDITPIEELDPNKYSQNIIGIMYDKNLKDIVEEAEHKGLPIPKHKPGMTKFVNFIIEDDTDFMTIRVSTHNFDKFKKLIFEELKDNDAVLIQGKMGNGIRMFFANNIIKL